MPWILKVLTSGRRRWESKVRVMWWGKDLSHCCWLLDKGAISQGRGDSLLEVQTTRCGSPPHRASKATQPCQHLDFGPLDPILDFWPTEQLDDSFMLYFVMKFVVICYSSHRKLTHRGRTELSDITCDGKGQATIRPILPGPMPLPGANFFQVFSWLRFSWTSNAGCLPSSWDCFASNGLSWMRRTGKLALRRPKPKAARAT